jgi:hypothetical protein
MRRVVDLPGTEEQGGSMVPEDEEANPQRLKPSRFQQLVARLKSCPPQDRKIS